MINAKYWVFDKKTKVVNPKELTASIRAGTAQIPRTALTVRPLAEKAGFAVAAKADLSGTEYIADNRGKIIYNTDDSKKIKTISELGEIEAGWTLDKPLSFSKWENGNWVQQLDLLQQDKHKAVRNWRNLEESKPEQRVIVDSLQWDAEPASRDRIQSTLQSAFIPPFWTDADNVDQAITREQLQAVHTAIVELGFAIHARQREMKEEIAALTSCAAVNHYVIGWPV